MTTRMKEAPTKEAPSNSRSLKPEQAARADQLVAAAREGKPAPFSPPSPPPQPPPPEAKRGRGRPRGSTTSGAARETIETQRLAFERASRAMWIPVLKLAEKFGAEPGTDDDIATLVDATVPMYEKYGGPPIEVMFALAVVAVLGPRAVTVGTVVYVKHKARQAGQAVTTAQAVQFVREVTEAAPPG